MENLEISRDFEAAKVDLYHAWTEPEELKQWWRPMGKELTEVENDIREGGNIRYLFGEDQSIDGRYEKVNAPDLLEYTWNWHLNREPIHDAEYRLSVRFEGDDQRSSLNIRQDGFKDEAGIMPHRHGWEQALDQLEAHLNGRENYLTTSAPDQQTAPITGYMQTPEQEKVGGG